MKLLSFSIPKNKENFEFKSLKSGFDILFHNENDEATLTGFNPYCFAGLNGSGKSNVLEALANIFYHLEIMSARILPESIRKQENFKRHQCLVDVFRLEYLIGVKNSPSNSIKELTKVSITKEIGKEPVMKIKPYPFTKEMEWKPIPFDVSEDKSAPTKIFLPDHIIGYSSGENELLSLPFIKSRFIQLDEYRDATRAKVREYKEPENSLIYIDSDMSQAALVSILLFENEKTLEPIRNHSNTGILDIRRFTIYLTYQQFDFQNETGESVFKLIEGYTQNPEEDIPKQIEKLKRCATCWYEDESGISLDFFVTEATKEAFKSNFENAFELFQLFHLFYILNNHFIERAYIEDVYQSKGSYTDWKIPVGAPDNDAFYFLKYFLIKQENESAEPFDILLRDLSDGEHQFLHTTSICLLLKSKRALLLLDEPETHFNPSWRARFIKILNDGIDASKDEKLEYKVHLQKDILLTSHSPFIISDCMPDNVVLFERKGKITTAKKASELGIDTYGTSVNLLTNRIFKNKETIGTYAMSKLKEFKKRFDGNEKTEDLIEELNSEFGDSIEKLMIIKEVTDKKQ